MTITEIIKKTVAGIILLPFAIPIVVVVGPFIALPFLVESAMSQFGLGMRKRRYRGRVRHIPRKAA